MPYEFKYGDRPIEGLTVQRAVGRGGFGEVYYALTDSGKQVALKYLRENPEIELRGIAQVMNLKSPHLITIYDVRRNEAGDPFVIMEYVSGPSLRELLINEPQGLSLPKAAFFLKGICRGLSYLHERGVVHRDLKPGNIFYDDGYVKIGDYGLSKHMSMSKHSGQTVSVGTVHYMAPEIGSGSYTQAIDVYALGVILFEMLTGRLPFSGSSMGEVLMRHLRDAPDLSGIPAPFAPVIAKALAKDPEERYQNADEMVAAVMESADVSASVDSFDATALSQVPRVPTASDDERTMTATPAVPPVPPLDVRDGFAAGELPQRLQRRLDHLTAKLERRARKLEKRYGHGKGGSRRRRQGDHMPTQHGSRFAQVVLLLVVTAAVATALGFLHTPPVNEPPAALILGFYLIGATLGPLLAHLRFLQRSITRHALLDRLVYASVAGLFMLPFALISFDKLHDPQLARVMLAPMAAMLICDWGRRIEIGRLGRVDGGSAFWPAIVGLCTAMFFGASDCALVAAGINAALVLITQGTAALWPAKPAAHRMDILGAGHSALRPAAAPRPEPQAEQAQRVPTDEETAPQEDAASSAPPPPPPIPTVQPSFVGRTAHAGVSFLAKLLLLTGLLLALGQTTFRSHALVAIERGEWQVDNHVATAIERGLPPGIVLGALIVGSFLLIVARRREGAAHFVRGCIGCGFLMWGAIMALTWGGPVLHVFFSSQDWSQLRPGHYMSLTGMGIAFGIAAVLLLWPTARRERPIVI